MLGLMKNHYYKIISNFKILLWCILCWGILAIVINPQNTLFLVIFLYMGIVGLPFITAIGLRKDSADKWHQYMLTFPVRRREIVASVYLTQMIILCVGIIAALMVFFSSFEIHGFPFDRHVDVVLLFSLAIGISLLANAIFLPVSYFDTKDRIEAMALISSLVGIGIMVGIIFLLNQFVVHPSDTQLILFGVGMQILGIISYGLSYLGTGYML